MGPNTTALPLQTLFSPASHPPHTTTTVTAATVTAAATTALYEQRVLLTLFSKNLVRYTEWLANTCLVMGLREQNQKLGAKNTGTCSHPMSALTLNHSPSLLPS